jgi:hypothetical protein
MGTVGSCSGAGTLLVAVEFKPVLVLTDPPIQIGTGGKATGALTCAEVSNVSSNTFTSTYVFMAWYFIKNKENSTFLNNFEYFMRS